MTPQELEKRTERAKSEPLVISKTDEGFKVYYLTNHKVIYRVTGEMDALVCPCHDFQSHASDPEWQCKHVIAIKNKFGNGKTGIQAPDPYEATERAAIQNEGVPEGKEPPSPGNGFSQMVLKRSVSPDGRIDSLSVELSIPVDGTPVAQIQSQAQKALQLQSGIVEGFLNGKGNGKSNGQANNRDNGKGKDNGAIEARMLSIGGMNGKWGRRLFINILLADGRTVKLFGNKKQLGESITAVGFPTMANTLAEGMQLNIPCQVITKPSEGKKYLNVEKVLPANGGSQT